ncbi:MAG: LAGLIDADG endonuclease [Candidatus Paceibacterota bacterium]
MDNTVGSLTQHQKSVVIGSILGDGYLRIVHGRKNAFLEINHSYSQREYVEWKHSVLKAVCISGPKVRKNNGKRIAYRFYTRQLPEMTDLMKIFYKRGEKIVPETLRIDPVILATWFMDDGSRCRDADVYLNTQQFGIESQESLLRALKKLGLEATLNKDKKYFRIRFLKSSIQKLHTLVEDHIHPSMKYKIGL